MATELSQNEINFLEGVQTAQIKELFSKVRLLEYMVDDLANQIITLKNHSILQKEA